MPVKKSIGKPLARMGLVAAVTAASVVCLATPSFAVGETLTSVTPNRGPSGGGNTLVLTTPTTPFTGTPAVEFSWTSCASSYTAVAAVAANATSPYALTAGIVAGGTTAILGNTKQLSVVVPSGLQLQAGQTTASFYVCVYSAITSGTLVSSTSTAAYTIAVPLTLSSNYGPSGGGNQIVATTSATVPSTAAVQFQYTGGGWCPAAPATAAAPAATAGSPPTQTAGVINVPTTGVSTTNGKTTITVPSTLALTTAPAQPTAPYHVCIYTNSTSTGTLLAGSAAPYTIAGRTLALSASNGPIGGPSTVVASLPNSGTFPVNAAVELQFVGTGSRGGCSPTWLSLPEAVAPTTGLSGVQTAGTFSASDVRILTNRLTITVPTIAFASGQTSAPYNVCVYSGNTATVSPLLAGTIMPYTLNSPATITGVTPSAGSTQGSTKITVFGTNFAPDMTASIAGQTLNITSVSDDATTFTAVAPPHAVGGPYAITVTTMGGSVNATGMFSYTNGITVTPNSAPNTKASGTDIDITGVGFSALSITPAGTATNGATPDATGGHVYLVQGTYDATGTAATSFKANGEAAECINVLPLGDTELICTLYAAGNPPNSPMPAAGPCTTCAAANNSTTMTATTYFTEQMVGMGVTDPTNPGYIPAGTIITSVTDSGTATLSNPTTHAVVTADAVNLAPERSESGTSATASGTTVVTVTAGHAYDAGRTITGPDIQPGTTISSVTGNALTLSKAATADVSAQNFYIGASAIPVGTYTVTVVSNGATDANVTDSAFTQSAVSSGSTFTVSNY